MMKKEKDITDLQPGCTALSVHRHFQPVVATTPRALSVPYSAGLEQVVGAKGIVSDGAANLKRFVRAVEDDLLSVGGVKRATSVLGERS